MAVKTVLFEYENCEVSRLIHENNHAVRTRLGATARSSFFDPYFPISLVPPYCGADKMASLSQSQLEWLTLDHVVERLPIIFHPRGGRPLQEELVHAWLVRC